MLTCQTEQVVGAKTRLHILKGYIVMRFTFRVGMTDILEHFHRRWLYIDLFSGDLHRFHQLPGVRLGRIGGGEAGHRVAADRRARQSQTVAGLGRDDERMS